jgi:hypothetical protein
MSMPVRDRMLIQYKYVYRVWGEGGALKRKKTRIRGQGKLVRHS